MSRADRSRSRWGQIVAKLLPGDCIHDVAPTSGNAPATVRMAVLDAAKLKRMRKLQRRARQAQP